EPQQCLKNLAAVQGIDRQQVKNQQAEIDPPKRVQQMRQVGVRLLPVLCRHQPVGSKVTGTSSRFTKGPAAILQRTAPGRGGGLTKATPPSGQSTICLAVPPTERQARAWPNSCNRTRLNRERYSPRFHQITEYVCRAFAPLVTEERAHVCAGPETTFGSSA